MIPLYVSFSTRKVKGGPKVMAAGSERSGVDAAIRWTLLGLGFAQIRIEIRPIAYAIAAHKPDTKAPLSLLAFSRITSLHWRLPRNSAHSDRFTSPSRTYHDISGFLRMPVEVDTICTPSTSTRPGSARRAGSCSTADDSLLPIIACLALVLRYSMVYTSGRGSVVVKGM